jgi:hypothetical protein
MVGKKAIIFSPKMAEAVYSGAKTKTRRVVRLSLLQSAPALSEVLTFAGWSMGEMRWIKERWAVAPDFDGVVPSNLPLEIAVWYGDSIPKGYTVRNPMFMPRSFARGAILVERIALCHVQSMSDADALAEGIIPESGQSPVATYQLLWDSLNKKRGYSWEANPLVLDITFRVLTVTSGSEARR